MTVSFYFDTDQKCYIHRLEYKRIIIQRLSLFYSEREGPRNLLRSGWVEDVFIENPCHRVVTPEKLTGGL